MKKTEIIKLTADKAGTSTAETRKVVNSFLEVIKLELQNGEAITINEFGKFYLKPYRGRTVQTPQGEIVETHNKDVPAFKPSKAFKLQCNNGRL